MLSFAIGALVVSIIAGALGFTGIARAASTVAKVIFGLFLAVALILFALLVAGIQLFT